MLRVVAIAIALCGCRDQSVEQIKVVRDEVCACKTVACGDTAMKALPQHTSKPDHRARALASEMLNCMAKLHLRERPETDPDRPTDPVAVPEAVPEPPPPRLP